MNEEISESKLNQLINYLLRDIELFSNEILPLELGETVITLYDLLSIEQQKGLRLKACSEVFSDFKKTIEFSSDIVEITYDFYDLELRTKTVSAQHEDSEEIWKNCYESGNLQDIGYAHKHNIIQKISKLGYLKGVIKLEIVPRECFLQITHNHYYVQLRAVAPKLTFNDRIYSDVDRCATAVALKYHEKLESFNTYLLKAQHEECTHLWHDKYTDTEEFPTCPECGSSS